MKSVTILTPSLSDQLEVQQLVTLHDSLLHRHTVGQIILNGLGNHHRIVVDVERTAIQVFPHRKSHLGKINLAVGDYTTNEDTALDLRLTLEGKLYIIVYIFLADHLYQVFFQLKAGTLFPFSGNLLILGNIGVIKADHDTIGVELNDFQRRAILNEMDSHFKKL